MGNAKGLFRATGKISNPVMTGLINDKPVFVDNVPRNKDDFYPTPPEPTRSLLKEEFSVLKEFKNIWEPACGDGAMVSEIKGAGLSVIASDLIDRGAEAEIRSFYDFKAPLAPAIITNPPFNECNSGAWIRHALEVLKVEYMALLLPLNWPGAESRAGLWAKHPPSRVYLMRWRIDFTGAGSPPMLNAWFVWHGKTDADDTRLLMMSKSDVRQGNLDLNPQLKLDPN